VRRPSAFISSTYRDLKYERRFVRELLDRLGFEVVTMEENYRPEFPNWERWSLNRAGQCDVLIQLLGERVGTHATPFILTESISKRERDHAQYTAAVRAPYRLHRPFPDAYQLHYEGKDKYEATLQEEDDLRNIEARIIERSLRIAEDVRSIAELGRAVTRDTSLSAWALIRHRCRRSKRQYWDTTAAAWSRAWEDESHVASTDHDVALRQLRRPLIGFACVVVPALLWLFRWPTIAIVLLAGGAFGLLIALACAPSYCWVGEKTLIARGLFGLRTIQQFRTEPFSIRHFGERLLGRFCLDCVRVEFATGRSVLVPLIYEGFESSRATVLDTLMPAPPQIDSTEYPDFNEAIRQFAEELQREDDDRRENARKDDPPGV
jgi:Domain of unknown function (DUF4062)